MLVKLFKPKWQSSDAAVRLHAVAGLDDERTEQQKVLIKLACYDESTAVRKAAIERLGTIDALKSVIAEVCDGSFERQALEKLGSILVRLDYKLTRVQLSDCLLYTSPSPRDGATSRMPSSA